MQNRSWRRLWHFVGGSFFPVLALFIPEGILLVTLKIVTVTFVMVEIARFISPGVNQWMMSYLAVIFKKGVGSRLTGGTWLLLASLAVFLLFDKYVAITSLLFLSIGDMMAGLIGEKYGKRMVFNKKSLEGSLACLASCLAIAVVMSILAPTMVMPVAIAGAVSATAIELLPIPIDDNFTMPLFSAGIMMLASLYFV
jgi:acyl phosphate:glycerol-3-phosphate acyltransferase